MAVYEYKCDTCKVTFEEQRKMGDVSIIPKCPKCRKNKNVRKIISVSSVSFKDNGFTKYIQPEE